MICRKKLNNVEYWQIKTNIYFGLYLKSQFKTNSYSLFYKKGICLLCKKNMLACFDPIWVPNNEMNTKYFK